MKDKILLIAFALSAIGYSVFRDSEYSVWVKAIPIFCCLLLYIKNGLRAIISDKLIVSGLLLSIAGDIALDLELTTLGIGIFTLVMMIYGVALYYYNRSYSWPPLILITLLFGAIYYFMYPHLGDRRISGAIYQIVLCWMVWRGTTVLINEKNIISLSRMQSWLVLLGTVGIAMNGVLYGVDLYLHPIPRDLVIHSYYFGQLFLVFGLRNKAPNDPA